MNSIFTSSISTGLVGMRYRPILVNVLAAGHDFSIYSIFDHEGSFPDFYLVVGGMGMLRK